MATAAQNMASMMIVTESQRRIDALSEALTKMQSTTYETSACCDRLTRRARHLDSLTSPASDASATLTQASSHLTSTLALMKDARDKYDTVADCEPAIERLLQGATEALEARQKNSSKHESKGESANSTTGGSLTEQDVYAAADSMEIIRDAYNYFQQRPKWRSTPSALGSLERVHLRGVDAMCILVTAHLSGAGPAVRIKRVVMDSKANHTAHKNETSAETRTRLAAALQNRDLMKSVGEYEEYLPLETRPVRELRAIFECLGGDGASLGPPPKSIRRAMRNPPSNKVVRTEKVGSGAYTNLTKKPLKSGYANLDAYSEARKNVAWASLDTYYRQGKKERRHIASKRRDGVEDEGSSLETSDVDAAARDAVRCLEHAMVVVAGEKTVYRCVVSPTSSHAHDDSKVPHEYKQALVQAYSSVVASVVDRTMDIIETVFMKEGGIGAPSGRDKESEDGSDPPSPILDVRRAGGAAGAGLRMLDGVRMLGPSLIKLCDMSQDKGASPTDNNLSVAANLCMSIHRTTVKNAAKTLENLEKAIKNDPLEGPSHRPPDASVAAVSADVVRAIRIIVPFDSAYKSVTKRRALQWDPKTGEEAGNTEIYVRFLINRLLNNLQGKALAYTQDVGVDSQAKSNLFLMNNLFYLTGQLGSSGKPQKRKESDEIDGEMYKIEGSWFKEKIEKMFEEEKMKYLAQWEGLNTHLSTLDKGDLSFQSANLLSLDSGRIIKGRFTGFIEDFEKTYYVHKRLTTNDPKLRQTLIEEVKEVFVPRYKTFFDTYSKINFSKKNQEQYLKYPPMRVESMIGGLYATM